MAVRTYSLNKDGVKYIFRCCPGCEGEVMDEAMQLAEDPASKLDWMDAASLGWQMTQEIAAEGRAACTRLSPPPEAP